jgi:UPF0288 family protein (methanogenesis marker protein 3)
MKGLELLETYPLSAEVVRASFMQKMIQSVKGDDEVPEDFKNFMIEQGIENDKMAIMIDANPRMLFDVFDENDIVIETLLYPSKEFTIKIGDQATTNSWKTRKEAELFAIDAAFEMLENQLKPISDDSDITADSEDN